MKKMQYKDVPADAVGEEGASDLTIRWVIAEKDGAPNFSMRVFEVEPGGHSPFHSHPWEHEVFILEGKGTLVQADAEVPISKGDVVFVAPGEQHQFKNSSSEKMEFICVIPNPE
jgi:quercetin dioxygenase-like cupin family protein